jgi:serine phosphatase RsbU (regulator of sigma subunit)
MDSANILITDDNQMNRDMLSRRLIRLGHNVSLAETGQQCLDMLAQGGYDLVLLDIMMPGMNGYDVLKTIKASDALKHIPVIMISAVDEIQSVVTCIEMGAEEYLPKPFNPVLLKARVAASLEKKHLRDKERLYAKSLARELEIGREIQSGFFPDTLPQAAGWEFAAHFEAARQVAGDFYDAFTLPDQHHIGIVIGDVCDKGVGAALFMALFRSLLRAFAEQQYAIAADHSCETVLKNIFNQTNNYIARTHTRANMFATVFFGILDPASGYLTYINGGHESPLVARPSGELRPLAPTGPAVGLLPGLDYTVQKTELTTGDLLVAVTDGITEARDAAGGFYGEERLAAVLARPSGSAAQKLASLVADVRAFVGEAEQADDITMIAVRRA